MRALALRSISLRNPSVRGSSPTKDPSNFFPREQHLARSIAVPAPRIAPSSPHRPQPWSSLNVAMPSRRKPSLDPWSGFAGSADPLFPYPSVGDDGSLQPTPELLEGYDMNPGNVEDRSCETTDRIHSTAGPQDLVQDPNPITSVCEWNYQNIRGDHSVNSWSPDLVHQRPVVNPNGFIPAQRSSAAQIGDRDDLATSIVAPPVSSDRAQMVQESVGDPPTNQRYLPYHSTLASWRDVANVDARCPADIISAWQETHSQSGVDRAYALALRVNERPSTVNPALAGDDLQDFGRGALHQPYCTDPNGSAHSSVPPAMCKLAQDFKNYTRNDPGNPPTMASDLELMDRQRVPYQTAPADQWTPETLPTQDLGIGPQNSSGYLPGPVSGVSPTFPRANRRIQIRHNIEGVPVPYSVVPYEPQVALNSTNSHAPAVQPFL